MRLDRLEIRGFFHFGARATVDLAAIPSGVVAIVGGNGEGKTRTLEAPLAGLYGPGLLTKAFPSRPFPLAEYATSRDAFIETTWAVDGQTLVSRVNVDGVARLTDAVLSVDGQPVNDGKVSTYRDAVAERFPSRRSVLCSAFATQNREGSFVELGQKDRMALFVELTDLAHYQEKHETAASCALLAQQQREKLQAVQAVLEREAGPAMGIRLTDEARLAALAQTRTAQAVEALRDRMDVLFATRSIVQQYAEDYAVAAARMGELEHLVGMADAAVERAVADERRALSTAERERMQANTRLSEALAEIARRRDAAQLGRDRRVAECQERIRTTQALLAHAEDIRAAVAARDRQAAELVEAQRALRGYFVENQVETDKSADIMAAKHLAEQATKDLGRARNEAALLKGVPFGHKCAEAGCRYVMGALEAEQLIPALEVSAAQLPQVLIELTEREAVHLARVKEQKRLEATVDAIQHRPIDPLVGLVQNLAAAEAELAGWTTQMADAETTLAARHQECAVAETTAIAALAKENDRIVEQMQADLTKSAQARAEADGRAAELRGERDKVQATLTATAPSAGELVRVDGEMKAVAMQLETALAAAGRAEAEVEGVKVRQATYARQAAILATLAGTQAHVEREWLAWQALAKACGRDGLQRLEVDAAGPQISATVNDLLAAAFGTRFTLQLVTQVATADGKGVKESFTIEVYDNDHGGEARDIADLSGGERVVVEEALRAGIAIYVNDRSPIKVRTCWRDEPTAGLQADNMPKYVAMLRHMHQIGGFAHTLFVTHSEVAASLADTVIRVTQGQPVVEGRA